MSKKKKILIVEEEVIYLSVFSDKFKSEYFDVFEAKNGQEGFDIALKEHPDLILLDIAMPVMDGLTMLSKLREDKWGEDANVILLTNYTDENKIAEAGEKGVFEYLVKKDWSVDDLVEKVKEKLK